MHFAPSDAQETMRATTRAFLAEVSSSAEVRRVMEASRGFDAAAWRSLADELGLLGLLIPEAHGGAGLGLVELALVMQEMGRVLFCGPYLSAAVLAPLALAELGDDSTRARLYPAIAAGNTRISVALPEPFARPPRPDDVPLRAIQDGERFRIHGRRRFVIDGASSELILVVTGSECSEFRLLLVEGDAVGLRRTSLDTLDPTRKQAQLDFDAVLAQAAGPPAGGASLARLFARASVALAAEQAGGAERTLEDALAHAGVREQFGRPIGSFQAIKHKCADMLMAAESAKSAAWYAAWAAENDATDAYTASHVAKSTCSEAYLANAGENLQIHGGLGFTWESDAHLHLRRARSSWALFGTPAEHREHTAAAMGLA